MKPEDGRQAQRPPTGKLERKPLAQVGADEPVGWALRIEDVESKRFRNGPRTGQRYPEITFADRTGTITGKAWDFTGKLQVGMVMWVTGRVTESRRWGRQLEIDDGGLRYAKDGEYDIDDLVEPPAKSLAEHVEDLAAIIAKIQSRFLRRLVENLIGPSGSQFREFCEAPAAMRNHDARRHGLIEHSVLVARSAGALGWINDQPPHVLDVAVAGALLHDIGKLESYSIEDVTDAIDVNALETSDGHIPLGYYSVRRASDDLLAEMAVDSDVSPEEMAAARQDEVRLRHVILSHHGKLEHGSPVKPAEAAAILVAAADEVTSKLSGLARLLKSADPGVAVTEFDWAFGGRALVVSGRDEG